MPLSTNLRPVVSAEKAMPESLEQQIRVFRDDQFVRQLLDAIPSLLAVLNSHRQIIYANRALIEMLELENEQGVLGQRPGDVFECIHVFDADGGCGASDLCRSCGALVAITSGVKSVEECRMTRLRQSTIQAHELQVTTTPFSYAGETFTIFSIEDKSAEHRRQMLERIFFHDILNVVGSIRGFAELLELLEGDDRDRLHLQIREAADQIIGEVEAQRMLSDAEHGRLELKQEICSSIDLLQRVVRLYEKNKVSSGRQLQISAAAVNEYLVTDQNLMLRILGNMTVNALEAIPAGETVTLDCQSEGNAIVFTVQNPGLVDEEARTEIFRRTYSTKGPARGLGTYSMRLLAGFLQGATSFESSADQGTVFYAKIPRNMGSEQR